jgi:hypothetical protein
MTEQDIREKFIASVLQGLYANPEYMKWLGRFNTEEEQAEHSAIKAVMVANATIKEMQKTIPQ